MTARKKTSRFTDMLASKSFSSLVIFTGISALIAMPFLLKGFDIEFASVSIKGQVLNFGWGIILVGLIIRFIDKWNGAVKK